MVKIYQPKGRAREYSPFAINHFSGCDHQCLYCYVPRIAKLSNEQYIHSNVSAKDLDGLERNIANFAKNQSKNKQQILLSFMGDPYCGAENGETREIISMLMKHNLHFNILTKNPVKAKRDLDILCGYPHAHVGTTITVSDEKCDKWEHGAPIASERLFALYDFKREGIKTWISFEPVIFPKDTLDWLMLINNVDYVKIGKLNNFSHPDIDRINWKAFLVSAVRAAQYRKIPFYIKQDLLKYCPTVCNNVDMDYFNA